jgi:hypothetical protein
MDNASMVYMLLACRDATGSKNAPAVTFYLKNGFSKTEETRVTERLSLLKRKFNTV